MPATKASLASTRLPDTDQGSSTSPASPFALSSSLDKRGHSIAISSIVFLGLILIFSINVVSQFDR